LNFLECALNVSEESAWQSELSTALGRPGHERG
jgi:hypothetical protein